MVDQDVHEERGKHLQRRLLFQCWCLCLGREREIKRKHNLTNPISCREYKYAEAMEQANMYDIILIEISMKHSPKELHTKR